MKVIEKLDHPDMEAYLFDCPGCDMMHMLPVSYTHVYRQLCLDAGRRAPEWAFNGSMEKPTFSPSLLVSGTRMITNVEHARIMAGEKLVIPKFVCHSFITNGQIQFLSDCTHKLTGQTVDLEPVTE